MITLLRSSICLFYIISVQVTIVELQKNGKIINTDTVEVDIGRPTTLGCNIIPSNNRPPSTVTWYIGSTVKQQSPSTSYTVTATKTDNGKIIYCKVYNLQSESQAVESSRAKLLVRGKVEKRCIGQLMRNVYCLFSLPQGILDSAVPSALE